MIRSMKVEDASAICQITNQSLGYEYSFGQTKDQIDKLLHFPDQHYLLVFEKDDSREVVGYLHAQHFESVYFDSLLNILGLAVLNTAQGMGVGRSLIEAVEELAKEKDYKGISLYSGSYRPEAHAFYQHLGYDGSKTSRRFIKYF